jgi:hypothetical protein
VLIQDGRKSTENAHPFGRDNEIFDKIVVDDVPGNWHRAFDDRFDRRHEEVLKRPGDNPLHQIAVVVARLGDAADTFADYARRQKWPEWAANLADKFASAANSAAEWLLILAGKLEEWRPGWIGEMPKWHP